MAEPHPFPPDFVALMETLLGSETGAFFDALDEQPARGIRLRDRNRFFSSDCLSPIPWSENAWHLSPDSTLGRHPLHSAGAFYLQEPSAMAPAAALAPKDGMRVLDLCAAPGGKSVQLAHMIPNGVLVANEIHPGRASVLSANIERMGLRNCYVVSLAPEKLAERFPEAFDCVLVDAPCSGEGVFRKNPAAKDMWSLAHVQGSARRQRGILADAARMVAPGGRMAYSTCTFNGIENEGVADDFLRRHPAFAPLPFALPGLPEAKDGRLRLWPHRVAGEGQFVALFVKQGSPFPKGSEHAPDKPGDAFLYAATLLMRDVIDDPLVPDTRFRSVAALSPAIRLSMDGVPLLRIGLHAARLVGKGVRPDHALALSANARQELPVDEETARRFLEGAPLSVTETLRGWVMPTLSGFALGWGKASGGVLKNHLPKALRGVRRPIDE